MIRHFLTLAEARLEEARKEHSAATAEIEDLEATESPEDMMLATVQGVDDKSRAERETLTPWLKFLWEAYRSVLDILRNNNKLETLYHVPPPLFFFFLYI